MIRKKKQFFRIRGGKEKFQKKQAYLCKEETKTLALFVKLECAILLNIQEVTIMNYTKIALMDSFWSLLEENPYSKITVNDIVDRCDLNRNTFYYHFHDIPEILTVILESATSELIEKYAPFDTLIDCIEPIIELILDNQKPIMNIYNSMQKEVFLEKLDTFALQVSKEYIEKNSQDMGLEQDDKEKMSRFYKCIIVGIYLDWLAAGLNYDPSTYLEEAFDHFKAFIINLDE